MPNSQSSALKQPLSGYVLWFIALSLAVYLMHEGAAILIPFVISIFVWYLINTLARAIERHPVVGFSLPRKICFLLSIFILLAGIWFSYKLVGTNAAHVMAAAPTYQKKLVELLPQALENIPTEYRPDTKDIIGYLDLNGVLTALVKTFTGVAGKTLIVLFYTGFFLYEQKFFTRKLKEMTSSPTAEQRVHKVLHNIDIKIQRYIGVKTLVSLLSGLSTWVLLLFFNVDFAAFWGLVAFILNFIPYVGSIAAIVLPSVVAMAQFNDVSTILGVISGLSFIHIVWSNIVEPRMMGDSLNLSPIVIIFSLAGWGLIWGVPGMFLSIPILSVITIILSQFDTTKPIAVILSKTGDIDDDIEKAA